MFSINIIIHYSSSDNESTFIKYYIYYLISHWKLFIYSFHVFLGNASLASKIRDITELRRPVIALQTSSSSSNDDQATIASVAAAAINAATALGKRRRVGYNSLTHVEVATEKRSSKRFISASTSTSTSNNLSLSGNIIGSSSTAPAIADEKSKRPLSQRGNKFAVSKTIIENTSRKEIDFEVDEGKSFGSVIKRMKIEISRLQEENDELLNDQFTRETEIRIEVRTFTSDILDVLIYFSTKLCIS